VGRRTDLQIVLDSIAQHFREFGGASAAAQAAVIQHPEGVLDSTPGRRRTPEQRARLLWRNFVRRCLKAIQNDKFAEVLGPEVVATNAVIVEHLIRALDDRGILDPAFALSAHTTLWVRLVGRGDGGGYLAKLSSKEATATLGSLKAHALPTRILGEL